MGANRVRKLRWLCRRGMKELDLLLESFLRQNQQALERGSRPDFEALWHNEDEQFWTEGPLPELPDAVSCIGIRERIRNWLGQFS